MQFRGHSPRTIFTGAPTLPQPLSHGAERRDSSPFRGAEGWAEVCGVCASVYHDADTRVSLTPVRGGVLDAPRLRDCRAASDAPVRHDQPHSRHPRCARLPPLPNASNPAGTARAPFVRAYRGSPSSQAGRAWKPAPTAGEGKVSAPDRRHPSSEGGASGTPPLTGGLYTSRCGIQRKGAARAPFGRTQVIRHPRPGGRGSPPLRRIAKVSARNPRRASPYGRARAK